MDDTVKASTTSTAAPPPTATSPAPNLREVVDRAGKRLPKIPVLVFLVFLFVIFPFWAFFLLPLAIFYQVVWKVLVCKVLFRGGRKSATAPSSSAKALQSVVPTPDKIVPPSERPYDVVVLGATGFTGTLAVQYLLRNYSGGNAGGGDGRVKPKIRFAMAGRSFSKLQALQAQLAKEFPPPTTNTSSSSSEATTVATAVPPPLVDIIVVDTLTPAQVISMVQKTQAVLSFVGPFQLYGGSIVMEACAKYGTHYLDITGEIDWVKDMLSWSPNNDGTTLDDIARQTGAKLINCCGNDCVPWDITFFKLHELLKQQDPSEDLIYMQCWDEIFSSPSGGTIATIIASIQNKDPTQAAPALDPFLKLPTSGATSTAKLIEDAQWWIGKVSPSSVTSMLLSPSYPITAPFVLAPFNAMIITRSLALLSGSHPNETTMRYREAAVFPDLQSAAVTTFVLVLAVTVILLSDFPPVNYLLQKMILKSGEGPSLEAQFKHYLLLVGRGTGSRGTIVEAAMYFPQDPGYMDTARMAVESTLCLVVPESAAKLPSHTTGGFWTPSTALGNVLLERLIDSGTHFASQVVVHRPSS